MATPLPPPMPDPARSGEDGCNSTISPADLEWVYADLRRHAQNLLVHERRAHTLQATALVNEATVKLLGEFNGKPTVLPPESKPADRRKMLFSMISHRMRQVLVEHARHRNALKGPGLWNRSPLHQAMAKIDREGIDLLALDEALVQLQGSDADAALVFEHRWFGGLSMENIAGVLDISSGEAQLRWNRARRLLRAIMRDPEPNRGGAAPKECDR